MAYHISHVPPSWLDPLAFWSIKYIVEQPPNTGSSSAVQLVSPLRSLNRGVILLILWFTSSELSQPSEEGGMGGVSSSPSPLAAQWEEVQSIRPVNFPSYSILITIDFSGAREAEKGLPALFKGFFLFIYFIFCVICNKTIVRTAFLHPPRELRM